MFLIISFVFCTTVHCENAVYSYTNKVYKYSIRYPSNFIIVDADSIDEICVSNKISRTTREMLSAMEELGWAKELVLVMNDQRHLIITISEYSSKTDISYQQYINSIRDNSQNLQYEVSEQNIQIDNIQGIQFVIPVTREGKKIRDVYITYIPYENYYFSIGCHIANNEQSEKNLDDYNNILDSFSFKK